RRTASAAAHSAASSAHRDPSTPQTTAPGELDPFMCPPCGAVPASATRAGDRDAFVVGWTYHEGPVTGTAGTAATGSERDERWYPNPGPAERVVRPGAWRGGQ